MTIEKALKRHPGVRSVLVNLVHGIVLVEADTAQITRTELATAIEKLGYDVSSTEVQQYQTDEASFALIKRRGSIGMVLAILDLLHDPLNLLLSLPAARRARAPEERRCQSWFRDGRGVVLSPLQESAGLSSSTCAAVIDVGVYPYRWSRHTTQRNKRVLLGS
jgi:copper chaperone CopZ